MYGQGRGARRQDGGSRHPVDPEELPVHALSTAEALLVWGIRHWVPA